MENLKAIGQFEHTKTPMQICCNIETQKGGIEWQKNLCLQENSKLNLRNKPTHKRRGKENWGK